VLDPVPSSCLLVNNTQGIAAPSTTYTNTSFLDCTPAGGFLVGFLDLPLNISVFIRDVKITQRVRHQRLSQRGTQTRRHGADAYA